MRIYSLLLLLALTSLNSKLNAQKEKAKLIGDDAFSRLMTNFYNFTITGSETPTTGFKVETNKPSINIKGNIISNRAKTVILNLDLGAELKEGVQEIFAGKSVNSQLKGQLGFNYLLPCGLANFITPAETEGRLYKHATEAYKISLAKAVDTFCVLKAIVDGSILNLSSFKTFLASVIALRAYTQYDLDDTFKRGTYFSNEESYMTELILGMLTSYNVPKSIHKNVRIWYVVMQFYLGAKGPNLLNTEKINTDYDRLAYIDKTSSFKRGVEKKLGEYQIKLTNESWTWKSIIWLNGSIGLTNSKFKLFETDTRKLTDSSSLLPLASLSAHLFISNQKDRRFFYLKVGASVQRVNSIGDQTSFDYRIDSVISSSPGRDLYQVKEGKAYSGPYFRDKGHDIFIELYYSPFKMEFAPGIFIRNTWRHGKAWINPNKHTLDIGLLWNVTNEDKEAKNMLSIVPYASWANLKTEYEDREQTKKKKSADLFSFGVKFGIPVNIGKKNK